VSKKEKNRTNNIYFTFPRSFEEHIILEIPEGYTATGIEKLNKTVENETGGFSSTAVLEGNKLIIKTFKYYTDYFQPNKNWGKLVDFLDAAYQFNQEKICLKKHKK